MDNFAAFIEKERARLAADRDALVKQKTDIDAKIAEVDKELKAITAYEAVKTGKGASTTRAEPKASRTGTRRTGIRQEILDLIAKSKGMGRADIIEAMGVKGSKADEQAVSNALAALKKAGTITADSGQYTVTEGA